MIDLVILILLSAIYDLLNFRENKQAVKNAYQKGRTTTINEIKNIINTRCGDEKCESCKYYYLPDRCKDVYTMDLLNKYFEQIEE